jgi:hypothetical protein
VTRKDTTPKHVVIVCAVCGRTLLRGEHAVTYLAGGDRKEVCELCTSRANHQGWIRESASLEMGQRTRDHDERRPLRARLRARRNRANGAAPPDGTTRRGTDGNGAYALGEGGVIEPDANRQVHAVPSSGELKAARALELFNGSEHPRTVAGVARSLGEPMVAVRPLDAHPSVVTVVVSWELCWYRYEVDLANGVGVRLTGQGYELDELEPEDQAQNAAADEHGALALVGD